MDLDSIDRGALERLRAGFLQGSAGSADYWHNELDLDAYDRTFAQRIAWKWNYVLDELARLGWAPPPGEALDWGCGSGIAGRTFAARYPAAVTSLAVHDRSALAMKFAQRRCREELPALAIRAAGDEPHTGTVLLSHVLTELAPRQVDQLVEKLASAAAIVWVEPATHESSRALIAVRERLVGHAGSDPQGQVLHAEKAAPDCPGPGSIDGMQNPLHMVAPCTHQAACGMLAAQNDRHWCHFFASPPPEVHTDSGWARFARHVGIDLRSLPLSYLVLDRRPVAPREGCCRLIGHPRVYKGYAMLFACDALGVRDLRLAKKLFADHYRLARKDRLDSLLRCTCEDGDIAEIKA